MFTITDVLALCEPGDIGLTKNPNGIGKLINFGQGLEDGTGKSTYGHTFVFAISDTHEFNVNGMIYESVMRISKNHIRKYHQKEMCIIRHKSLDEQKYFAGEEELLDNIGQIYPVHRLLFHGFDMVNAWIKRKFSDKSLKFRYMKFMPLDWPVCSEYATQFLLAAGLETGFNKQGWRGINPDDFDDVRKRRPDLYTTILEGTFVV